MASALERYRRVGDGQSREGRGDRGVLRVGGEEAHRQELSERAQGLEVDRAHARQIERLEQRLLQKLERPRLPPLAE